MRGIMKDHENILEKAQGHLLTLYKEREKEQTPFHTYERAQDLVEITEKIAGKAGLNDEDTFKVCLAASFVYTGFWQSGEQTEQRALANLESFLAETEAASALEDTKALIRSVNDDTEDKTDAEKVFYDAFYSFLGKKKLINQLEMRGLELDQEEGDLNEFRRTFEFTTNHKYRTDYAIRKFGKRKAKNSQKLLASIQKEEAKNKKAKRKSRKLGRGIETMYRTVYRNHINLSSIADAKANLIIRVNTIILSIIITLGGTGYTFFEQGFFKYSRFTIPVMIFVAGSLAAVIFAILSARPKVTNKEVTKKRLLGKESSILFFGNFTAMEKKDFVREMSLFRKNDDRVYDSMSVDIYYLGLVLDKKYKLVTYSYNVFMIGLTLSVVSFMAIFMLFQFSQ
ncbi:MAG: hypothetical protein Roseis2KO_02370 [Roseivirga sp.]